MADYPDLMARLDAVERQLLAAADDDFATKHQLHSQRDALRDLIHQLHGDQVLTDDRPTVDIQREIAALEASAEAMRRERPNRITQASGSNSAGDAAGAEFYQRNSQGAGYAAIQQRIGQLETTLENRPG